jgi:hypothetical protein
MKSLISYFQWPTQETGLVGRGQVQFDKDFGFENILKIRTSYKRLG